MKKFLEHINEQEYAVRRRWLIIFCAGAGLLVVGVWILTLRSMRADLTTDPKKVESAAQAAGSLQTLGQKISASWSTLKEGIGSTVVQFQNAATTTTATTTLETTSTNQ